MSWESELIRGYLKERAALMKTRWLTLSSWVNRSREKSRYDEVERLLDLEVEFNTKWINKISKVIFSKQSSKDVPARFTLLISTHSKKHRERGVFIAIFGALVAVILKLQTSDIIFSVYLAVVAFLVAGERIFTSNIVTALEELDLIVKQAEKHNNLSQQDAASGAPA